MHVIDSVAILALAAVNDLRTESNEQNPN